MFGYSFYVFVNISFFMPQSENNRPSIAEVKTLADNTHSTKFYDFVSKIIAEQFLGRWRII
jgi:hypothetical protein